MRSLLSRILRRHPKGWYREITNYKYQVIETQVIETGIIPPTIVSTNRGHVHLDLDGVMTLREEYCWDGPSGPTFDTPSTMRASLAHDGGYQLLREGKLPPEFRAAFDALLERLGVEDGMHPWRARLWRRGVERLAAFAARRR